MTSRGVIAAGHRLTAQAGADVLRAGGSAVDATVAAIAMACVCEPVLCSPGGGGFAMVRDADGLARLLDFFAHTPLRRDPNGSAGLAEVFADFGITRQGFHVGPGTTATPGLFAGLARLHTHGGTFPFAELLEPAIDAARVGVEITPFQHHLSTVVRPILLATSGAAMLFAPDGELIEVGGRMRNPALADALEILGVDGLSGSAVGDACVGQQAGRGHLTREDLEAFAVVERIPLSIELGDAVVHLNPLPAAGGALVAHTLARLRSDDPVELAEALAATDDARRRANGDLAVLANAPIRTRGTTHVSVIDADGNACATTVSNGEGNGEIVDGFGFMLNNVLGESDVNPAGLTDWPVDTRLSSMMCPTIVSHADGAVSVLGSGGSNRIRSAIGQVTAALCLGTHELDHAVTAPRVHAESGHLDFEDHFPADVADRLRSAFPDHLAWSKPDLYFGGVHAVRVGAAGGFAGAGDARRDGAAVIVDG